MGADASTPVGRLMTMNSPATVGNTDMQRAVAVRQFLYLCRRSGRSAGLTAALHGANFHPMMGASGISHMLLRSQEQTQAPSHNTSLEHFVRRRNNFGAFLRSREVHLEITMAEILGAVASGLAVAEVGLKVGGTVWKLKRLWQQVHEVPETIKDLMRQIEIMDPVLANHETDLVVQNADLHEQPPTRHSSPATLSAAYCREALNDLRCLIEDLDRAIKSETRSRRTFARMGVMLKKDTIRGFQDRLERAIKLLQWTQVNYLA